MRTISKLKGRSLSFIVRRGLTNRILYIVTRFGNFLKIMYYKYTETHVEVYYVKVLGADICRRVRERVGLSTRVSRLQGVVVTVLVFENHG